MKAYRAAHKEEIRQQRKAYNESRKALRRVLRKVEKVKHG